MKIRNVKGCYDFLPKEQKIRNYINNILKNTFEEYGYSSIETPILCYYDMLSDKYNEENDILKEIYKLKDQGERVLGLRYDLTVPFAKFIALNKNTLKFPFKRYEISKVFRDGPVKTGRDREFTQCDVDVVGLPGENIEAELLSIYVNAFNKMNIDIIIQYNSRNLMRGLVLEVIKDEEKISSAITIIDKINKITKEEFINYFKELNISKDKAEKLLNYFKLDLVSLKKLFDKTENPLIIQGLQELSDLSNKLKELNLDKYCIFTPSLARGQEYYTGNVFEVYDKSGYLTSSIGGGGRYDNMITDFINDGNRYPAVGVSFGLSSIYELLRKKDNLENISDIDLYIIPIETFAESFKIANTIRSLGVNVLLELENKKLKKCLEQADKENIPYTIVIGTKELEERKITLRNMKTKENFVISLDELSSIKNYIK